MNQHLKTMKTIDAYPNMLGDIFTEAQLASSIVISYNVTIDDNTGLDTGQPELTRVNGFNTLIIFAEYLDYLKTIMMTRILIARAELDDSDRHLFFRQAIGRCKKFAKITSPIPKFYRLIDPFYFPESKCSFLHPVFDPDQGPQPDETTRQKLIRLTNHHAMIWRNFWDVMTEDVEHLSYKFEYEIPLLGHLKAG